MTTLLEHPSAKVRRAFWLLAFALIAGNAVLTLHWTRWTGDAVPEWPMAFDLLLVLPACYLWVHRRQGRQAWWGAAALLGVGVLAGSWSLPETSKQAWRWLEAIRLPLLLVFVTAQALLLTGIFRAAWRQRGREVIEDSVCAGLAHRFGHSALTRLLALEARLWIYALLRRPAAAEFPGQAHFSVHAQGGNASNQVAFLVLMAAEIPLLHLLLHFLWSPLAALVITVLSLYGWLFLWAEYRATRLRPVSLDGARLRVRHGITIDFVVPLDGILRAERCRGPVRRSAGRLRAYGMGEANVRLLLCPGTRIETAFGTPLVKEIYLGVDQPDALLLALRGAQVAMTRGTP